MSYNVISSGSGFYDPFPEKQAFQRYNKYTIQSILNEFRWAFGEMPISHEAALCEVKPGLYCDLQSAGMGLSASLDDMRQFRETFSGMFRAVAEADVVIITLGLVETWYDNETGIYLNVFPGQAVIKAHPGRFSLHVMDYDEIYQALTETYDIISRHNSDFKMLITVSPVPLETTFRTQDVLISNTYSKAVQRAAVEAFVKKYPADYFPSYETVTMSDMRYAWSDHDYRHVRSEAVERIMSQVLASYSQQTEGQSIYRARSYCRSYLACGDAKQADATLQKHFKEFSISPALKYIAAEVALANGRSDEAIELLQSLLADLRDSEQAAKLLDEPVSSVINKANKLLQQCLRLQPDEITAGSDKQDHHRAISTIDTLLLKDPDNSEFIWLRNWLDRVNSNPSDDSISQEDAIFIKEASVMGRMRLAAENNDIDELTRIAKEALKDMKVSEEIEWELAMALRKAEKLEAALEHFAAIARRGGKRAVPAFKHARVLARQQNRNDLIIELAEKF